MILIPVSLGDYTDCILIPIRSDEIAFAHDYHMQVITLALAHQMSMRYMYMIKLDLHWNVTWRKGLLVPFMSVGDGPFLQLVIAWPTLSFPFSKRHSR